MKMHYKNCGTCGANLNWVLEDAGVLTILGSGAKKDYYNNCFILSDWYMDRRVKMVIINDGVTIIGDDAFVYC
jgi:hypothetical protein